jgi:hypothetical protein
MTSCIRGSKFKPDPPITAFASFCATGLIAAQIHPAVERQQSAQLRALAHTIKGPESGHLLSPRYRANHQEGLCSLGDLLWQ